MFILETVAEMCNDLSPVIKLIKIFLNVICWSVPIILVVLGTIDMLKAVSTNDEKVASEARGKLIKRIIYGIIVFLIPFFVTLVFEVSDSILPESDEYEANSKSWLSCWNQISIGKSSNNTDSKTNDSGSSTTKQCKYSCHAGGSLNKQNECYKRVLDQNYFDGYSSTPDCKKTCGTKAEKTTYESSGDGYTYCGCYYPVTKEC